VVEVVVKETSISVSATVHRPLDRGDERPVFNLWYGCSALDSAKDPWCADDDKRAAVQEDARSESYDRIGHLDIVNTFIKAGVVGEHLNLALATATRCGHVCVVDKLLVEEVDINVTKQGNDEKAVPGSGTLLQGAKLNL
jgi:hypothetical protein